ncbi:MAG: DUF3667 domain-containing protein [Muribaculaceae bacterium]|nr:DUF3667 domain-containing protein [Muribaculaceae bacterium]
MDQAQTTEYQERLNHWSSDFEFASDEMQHCQNCGHDFIGNYCPYCSQKAGEGLIDWRSVRQSFMDIWGLGSRSLPRTVWRLLMRPGYLISDYISGKRQVSFPPVKMLFFVSVIIALLIYWFLPLLFGSTFDVYGGQTTEGFDNWNRTHFAWTYFLIAILGILPTWVLFRYAPLHTRHTLPQGFFIQVFLCVLNLVLSFIILLPFLLINYTVYFYVSWAALLIYYVIAYKQLFGYGIWGTLWRVVIIFGFIVFALDSVMYLFFEDTSIQMEPNNSALENSKYITAGILMGYALILLAAGWLINLLIKKLARKKS